MASTISTSTSVAFRESCLSLEGIPAHSELGNNQRWFKDDDRDHAEGVWDTCSALDSTTASRILFPEHSAFDAILYYLSMPKTKRELALVTRLIDGVMHSTEKVAVADYAFMLATLDVDKSLINDRLIERNAVPRLLELVEMVDNREVQLWACWSLSTFSGGTNEHKRHLLESGIGPILIKLFKSHDDNVVSSALEILSNITYEQAENSKMLFEQGVVPALASIFGRDLSEEARERLSQCLINVLRYYPHGVASEVVLSSYFPAVKTILCHVSHEKNLISALVYRSLTDLTKVPGVFSAKQIKDAGLLDQLIETVHRCDNARLVSYALAILQAIFLFRPSLAIGHGVLPALVSRLSSQTGQSDDTEKIIAMLTSILRKRYPNQTAAMIEAGLIPYIVSTLGRGNEAMKYSAAELLHIMTSGIADERTLFAVLEGTLHSVGNLLTNPSSNIKLTALVLSILIKLVRAAKATNQCQAVSETFEQMRIIHHVEDIQWNDDEWLSQQAVRFTDLFYCMWPTS